MTILEILVVTVAVSALFVMREQRREISRLRLDLLAQVGLLATLAQVANP